VHPYSESPLRSELQIMASADLARCRTALFYSGTDKAGLAFLFGQQDDPRTLEYDRRLPTGMLGRVGLFGTAEQIDPAVDARPRLSYLPQANRANICSSWIGVNDGSGQGGDRPGSSRDATGNVEEMDLWHVDLWGWELPGLAYRSRHLFDLNGTEGLVTWDERSPDAFWSTTPGLPDYEVVDGGLGVKAAVETPAWHQITLRRAAVERAWRIPRTLIQQGWVEAP